MSEAVSFMDSTHEYESPHASKSNTYAVPPSSPPGAPATTVVLEMATEVPKASPVAVSEAVSFMDSTHGSPHAARSNTYAEPVTSLSPAAPTMRVMPETATEDPNKSFSVASEGVSLAFWMHGSPHASRSNTYTEPVSSWGVPTKTVVPETATDHPKRSFTAASEAVSLAISVQASQHAARSNTYAEPAVSAGSYSSGTSMRAARTPGAPTTAVVPEMATE